jgi:ribosome biogenesis GTPase A
VFLNRNRDPETGNWSRGLRLCDCPGLVFPLVDVPKSIQVLSSLFPLAQLREPFTAIHFASERLAVPLQDIYGLKPYNSDDESDVKYTKMDSSEQSRTMKPREKKAEKHKKVLVCDLEASMETAEQREGCADSEEVSLAEHDSEDKCAVQASSESFEWNGWSVCEALATARGFLTARSGRADVYRAAISILKDIVDGRVLVAWLPPLEHVS